ncbi:hypothetical protein M8494_07560 [Serratia ureilytica]
MLLGSGSWAKKSPLNASASAWKHRRRSLSRRPAMHVAHHHVINMLDGDALKAVIEQERPDYIVPRNRSIATAMLVELERHHRGALRRSHAPDHEPEGIRLWRRKAWPAHLQLPLCRQRGDFPAGDRAHRLPVHRQTGDEF